MEEAIMPTAKPGKENKWPKPSSPSGRSADKFIYKYVINVSCIAKLIPVKKYLFGLKGNVSKKATNGTTM